MTEFKLWHQGGPRAKAWRKGFFAVYMQCNIHKSRSRYLRPRNIVWIPCIHEINGGNATTKEGQGQTWRSALIRFLFMFPSLSPMRDAERYSTLSFPGKKNSTSSTKPVSQENFKGWNPLPRMRNRNFSMHDKTKVLLPNYVLVPGKRKRGRTGERPLPKVGDENSAYR